MRSVTLAVLLALMCTVPCVSQEATKQDTPEKKAPELLIQQLEDTDAVVRHDALVALQAIYKESPAKVDKEALIPKLCHILKEDERKEVRARALQLALEIRPDKSKLTDALSSMLSDKQWENRVNGCKAVAYLDITDKLVLGKLIGLLEDEFAQVRFDAAQALEGFGVEARVAIPLLQKMVAKDEVPQLRVEAGWPLMSILGKVQALKIPSVEKKDLHSVGLPIGPKGEWPRNFFLQIFGGGGGTLSGSNANRVVALTDRRTPPETKTFAVACYGPESRTICFRKNAVVHQYFITDKDYSVFPEGTLSIPPEGPFASVEVHVKVEDDKDKAGAEVKMVRGTEAVTVVTAADGVATIRLSRVKVDNIEIHVAPAKGKAPVWKASLTTYMRGARPDTVIYPIDVILNN